jgi:hypothetical protein
MFIILHIWHQFHEEEIISWEDSQKLAPLMGPLSQEPAIGPHSQPNESSHISLSSS